MWVKFPFEWWPIMFVLLLFHLGKKNIVSSHWDCSSLDCCCIYRVVFVHSTPSHDICSIRFIRSSIFDKGSTGVKGAYVVAGTVSGMLCGICCTVLLRTLQCSVLALCRRWEARKHQVRAFAARFRRACLVAAYFCAAGWLMLEYGELIGLKQLYLRSDLS